jgi:hypothetical protein
MHVATHFTAMLWRIAALVLLATGPALARPAATALSLSPPSVAMSAGTYTSVLVTGATGPVTASVRNPAIASVTLTNVTATGATLNVMALGAGSTTVAVKGGRRLAATLTVTVLAGTPMTVSPSSLTIPAGTSATLVPSHALGSVSAVSTVPTVAAVSVSAGTIVVRALAAGSTLVTVRDFSTSIGVPVTVTAPGVAGAKYSLFAWNDLGMHCMDGRDYSVFSILPPFNNLHAQLVNTSSGAPVMSSVTLTYEAVADPTGSINTHSTDKTNFWSWSRTLYGASPAPDTGLTGFATPSLTARPMAANATNGWFEATGIPVTPYDDSGNKNFYPTVKVTARDTTGAVLATATAVLPVSDEITCVSCHASRTPVETNPARLAAKPAAGWVNDANPEIDWKKNVLRLHDEKQSGNGAYLAALSSKGMPAGLYAAALAGTPTLCASCHASNALPGTGIAGISTLTSALHGNHAAVNDPATQLTLNSSTNRSACYTCHPGSVTQCLRGAMGNAVDASGNAEMGCQSCHGNMSRVGDPTRTGWLQEPNCQACHYNGTRTLSAVDANGRLVVPADTRFATNSNVPAAGFSLYRFSKGHGGMQCEACHGATHAEYPSSHLNDNLQSIAIQGYAGTVRECTACHAKPPLTATGGPHGMHTIGAAWVSAHGDNAGNGSACAYCHGTNATGTPLAQVKTARTFNVEGGSRSYAAGQKVTCYDCHNGPGGGDSASRLKQLGAKLMKFVRQ